MGAAGFSPSRRRPHSPRKVFVVTGGGPWQEESMQTPDARCSIQAFLRRRRGKGPSSGVWAMVWRWQVPAPTTRGGQIYKFNRSVSAGRCGLQILLGVFLGFGSRRGRRTSLNHAWVGSWPGFGRRRRLWISARALLAEQGRPLSFSRGAARAQRKQSCVSDKKGGRVG